MRHYVSSLSRTDTYVSTLKEEDHHKMVFLFFNEESLHWVEIHNKRKRRCQSNGKMMMDLKEKPCEK